MKYPKKAFNPIRLSDMLVRFYDRDGEVQQMQQERIRWLRKKCKKYPAVADRLESCCAEEPNGSGGCLSCSHAAQAMIADAARRFLKKRKGDGTIVCVSVVPVDGIVKPGKLSAAGYNRAVRRWKERLGKAALTWFIGATDFSFNNHENDRYEPHWSVHFYGVTVTDDPKGLKRRLRKYFGKSDVIPVPVQVKVWDGKKKALRYILKPNFWARIGRDDVEHGSGANNGRRSSRDTDKQRLPSKRKRELLVLLDQVGIQGRLVMKCCQFVNRQTKGPCIELRSPSKRGHGKVGK